MTEKFLGTSDDKYLKTGAGFGIIRSDIVVPNAKFILTNGDRLVFTPVEPHVKDFAVFAVIP